MVKRRNGTAWANKAGHLIIWGMLDLRKTYLIFQFFQKIFLL